MFEYYFFLITLSSPHMLDNDLDFLNKFLFSVNKKKINQLLYIFMFQFGKIILDSWFYVASCW